MYKLNKIDKVSFMLIIIGSLCLGIKGLTNYDLITLLFFNISPLLVRIIYLLIGVSAFNILIFAIKSRK